MFGRSPNRTVEEKSGPIPDTPGPYQLDPNHFHTQASMHKPGSVYWPGAQLDNGVTDLLAAPNYVGFNPYQRSQTINGRILQSSGGDLAANQPGVVLVTALEALIQ